MILWAHWLYKNRHERLDASIELFEDSRRDFHLARYQMASEYVEGRIVADIACGTSYRTKMLRVGGKAEKAVGIDIDPEAIEYARNTHMVDVTEFICASGDNIMLADESFEVVVSFERREHVTKERCDRASNDALSPYCSIVYSNFDNVKDNHD